MITNEAQGGVLVLWSINLCKCQWLGVIEALTFRDGKGESSLEMKLERKRGANEEEFKNLTPNLQQVSC